MKYERMKRNAIIVPEFNKADTAKLRKWKLKVDKILRDLREIDASNLSRDADRDFGKKLDIYSGSAQDDLQELSYMIDDVLD